VTVRGFAVAVVSLIVVGCASVSPKPTAVESENEIKWQQHHSQVTRVDQWDLSGRIGVRTTDTGASANLRWKFDNSRDQIDLFGPFGGGRIHLDIDPAGARLRDGKGREFFAASASEVLFKATGWHVPLEVLGYWVRGVPAPGEHGMEIDNGGRLISLSQQGWDITFREYALHKGVSLPRKIQLSASAEILRELTTRNEFSGDLLVVKLYIDEWEPSPDNAEMDQ
jgi:outer membrane lipoprotein LolB|tara:strand:+ start:32689 stop:33363 length:675 start_codon:yes stop_codon:yes gene_type:complete